jgi:hypothetical protein
MNDYIVVFATTNERFSTAIVYSTENNKYFIVWIYDNVFVWDKGCDSILVFPFH